MEAEALKLMIPSWKDDRRVTQYVHDKDSKTKKAIEKAGQNIEEMIDTNHCVKSFRRKFNLTKVKSPTKLYGLKAPLERFFQALLKIDLTIEEKQDLWLNAVEHFSGNHEKCMKHVACKPWNGISIGTSKGV